MAHGIMRDPKHALDTLIREELGLDPSDLGSPLVAAAASFVMFAIGAGIPLLPFLVARGMAAQVASGALSALVLGAVGAFLGVLSGTGAVRSASRMVGLAAIAAAVTILVGRLIGVSLA
jgi:VIT1/CCC1 family predicted Fe2+/Mn2+ transporter